MPDTIKVSAPGKIILHGEHAVVYGKLAIATSLDLRTTTTITETPNTLQITFEDLQLQAQYSIQEIKDKARIILPHLTNIVDRATKLPNVSGHDDYYRNILKCLGFDGDGLTVDQISLASFFYLYYGVLSAYGVEFEGLSVGVKTQLSLGAGTGSSASLMVSLAGALLRYSKIKSAQPQSAFDSADLEIISKWAFCAEKIIHGQPSGIDNTVCTYGSLVSYRKGEPWVMLEFKREIRALLVDSKIPKQTKAMVGKVADKRNGNTDYVDNIFDDIEQITTKAIDLYTSKDFNGTNSKKFYDLLRANHSCLVSLGISHPALDDIINVMADFGLDGKITGAGGGGYVFTILTPDYSTDRLNELCTTLSNKGYVPKITKLGGIGVSAD